MGEMKRADIPHYQPIAEGDDLPGGYVVGKGREEGGSGCVFRGTDTKGAPVAIKVVRGSDGDDLHREYLFLHELAGDGAPRVVDWSPAAKFDSFLVMEDLSHCSCLDDASIQALPLGQRVRLFECLVRVVDSLHAGPSVTIHGDLKPVHVRVTDDRKPSIKLIDFGTAFRPERERDWPMGVTRRYASSNRRKNGKPTTQDDLHALGVMLFDLCVVVPDPTQPAEGPEAWRLPPLPEMSSKARGAPREAAPLSLMQQIVDRSLEGGSAGSWASAGEMADALNRWRAELYDEEIQPSSTAYRGALAAELSKTRWPLVGQGSAGGDGPPQAPSFVQADIPYLLDDVVGSAASASASRSREQRVAMVVEKLRRAIKEGQSEPQIEAYCSEALCAAGWPRDLAIEPWVVQPRVALLCDPQREDIDGELRRGDLVEACRMHKHVVVLGPPGSGRTSMACRFAIDLCRDDSRQTAERLGLPWSGLEPVPFFVSLAGLAASLETGTRRRFLDAGNGEALMAFLENETGLAQHEKPWARSILEQGHGVLVLDGLDEVPRQRSEADRPALDRVQLCQVLASFLENEQLRGNRVVLTMRESSWDHRVQQVFATPEGRSGLHVTRLSPLDETRIATIVRTCYPDERHNQLLDLIREKGRFQGLARSPLLLAGMILWHQKMPASHTGSFPDEAGLMLALVQELCVDWDQQKASRPRFGHVSEWGSLPEVDRWDLMTRIGGEVVMERDAASAEPAGHVVAADRMRLLVRKTLFGPIDDASSILTASAERTGLIMPSRTRVRTSVTGGEYSMPSSSIRELLAARWLALLAPDPDPEHDTDRPPRNSHDASWSEPGDAIEALRPALEHRSLRNVLRLALAIRADARDMGDTAEVVEGLLSRALAAKGRDRKVEQVAAVLSGVDVFRRSNRDGEHGAELAVVPLLPQLRKLLEAGGRAGEPRDRAILGAAMAWFDRDPRLSDQLRWMNVPKLKGRRHRYEMQRWPLTVGEYAEFALDDASVGFLRKQDVHDQRSKDTRRRVQGWLDDRVNHPMTRITWAEANAYCGWWTERHARKGEIMRLPDSGEWQEVARLGGGDSDPSSMNVRETGLGSTTPVGIFASAVRFGAQPLWDVAGNVREWCSDGNPEGRFTCGGSFGQRALWADPDHIAAFQPHLDYLTVGFRPCKIVRI